MIKQEKDNKTTLEDLAVTEAQSDEVKGGINYSKIELVYIEQKPDGSLS